MCVGVCVWGGDCGRQKKIGFFTVFLSDLVDADTINPQLKQQPEAPSIMERIINKW